MSEGGQAHLLELLVLHDIGPAIADQGNNITDETLWLEEKYQWVEAVSTIIVYVGVVDSLEKMSIG